MNKDFAERIVEYLQSECKDYDMSYYWEWVEDLGRCEVAVFLSHAPDTRIQYINFKYDEANNDLLIELIEDCFYATRESDETVKYFWMLVSPALFPVVSY